MVEPTAMLLGIGLVWSVIAVALLFLGRARPGWIISIKAILILGTLLLLLALAIYFLILIYSGLGHSACAERQTRAAFPLLLFGLCICPIVLLFAYRRHCSSRSRPHPTADHADSSRVIRGAAATAWITVILSIASVVVLAGHAGLWPPIMYMLEKKYPEPRVRKLLELGFSSEAANVCGEKPLVFAALTRNQSLVELLLEFGANPNQIDDEDDPPPPLWWAAFNRDLGIAQVLIDNGAKAEGVGGRSPLMEASRNGDMEMVKLLIGKGAHVNSRNAHGTPLSSAAAADKIDAIQFLIEKGADLEGKDLGMAWTPLMRAASEGSMKAVKLLLEKGADSGVRDYTGASPASIAMQHNHRDVAELLASYDSKGRSHPKSANK